MAGRTVLIVDDDAAIRELLESVLSDGGYNVQTASDGAEALSLLRTRVRPDVLLLDIGMPVVNGTDFVRLYREEVEPPHAPIVIVTARGDGRQVGEELGADAYLDKPFDVEELERIVAEQVERNYPMPGPRPRRTTVLDYGTASAAD